MIIDSKYSYLFGIDPGTKTGISLYDRSPNKIIICKTMMIHYAIEVITIWNQEKKGRIFVIVEDPRKAVFGRSTLADRAKIQGAGSIKRDASIWEDFLTDKNIPFIMVRPSKQLTKWNADYFAKVTGYEGTTNSHSRDAAMLVFGR